MLVTAGSDLYAREIQARISTLQDTLDARHDMTKAKLEVTKLPPRRPKNQMRDSDLPSDIERGETHLHKMEDLLDILEGDSNSTQTSETGQDEKSHRASTAHLRRVGPT